ncbi:MAG: hypothetical protein OSB57_11405 [Planctomycetota bacterium]|nr:hypothetical protein [Planctomycetota bacterium]
MNLDPFRQFAMLKQEHTESKETTKRLRALMDDLQEKLIDMLLEEGVSSMPIDVPNVGSVLLYPRVSTFARAKDGDVDRLHLALENAGMGDVIKLGVNAQTLSAIARDADKPDGEALPQELIDALSFGEKHELAMRKQA